MKIAIDGPSGAGKSSLAKSIARELGLVYVDTGALYRSVGLYIKRKGADPKSENAVEPLLSEIKLELRYDGGAQKVILCGEDVSGEIRTPEMSMYASAVSALPAVRTFLLSIQRDMVARGNVVMDGRDIGTVIMPDADVKLFLVASPEARARRRCDELNLAGDASTYEQVLADIKQRDSADSGRAVAPAVPADDAIFIDNSDYEPEDTLAEALRIIKKTFKKNEIR